MTIKRLIKRSIDSGGEQVVVSYNEDMYDTLLLYSDQYDSYTDETGQITSFEGTEDDKPWKITMREIK